MRKGVELSVHALNQIIVATLTLVSIALSGCDSKSHSNGAGPSSTQPAAAAGTFRPEEVVVPIKIDSQAGAGFIAKMGSSFFFVTNIHVLSEFKYKQLRTALGKTIELPDECFLSRSRDVAMVPIKWDASALEVMGDAATGAKEEDPVSVWVLSNATVSRNDGVVVEILPDVVEVTSPFKPGNSGAPILHVASGKVLAIASYYVDDPDKARQFFAPRLDEMQAQLQKLSRRVLRRDAEFVSDYFETGDVYGAIHAALKDRSFFPQLPDTPWKRNVIAILEKHSLWDGRDVIPHNTDQLAALANDLKTTAEAGQHYLDHELQVVFYRKTLTYCIDQRNKLTESFDAYISNRER